MSELEKSALGLKGIRFSLIYKEMFKTQLRALLRASSYGKLKIMFPFVSDVREFIEAKRIVNKCKKELEDQGYVFDYEIELGILIEVPIVAIMIDQFVGIVDFFSVGTNDLIQYTFASNRRIDNLDYLNTSIHPGIFRMIKNCLTIISKENKSLSICGEMASYKLALPILIGLGLREFSIGSVSNLLKVKRLIKKLDVKECEILANKALTLSTTAEVKELSSNFLKTII